MGKDAADIERRLSSPGFVDKAPPAVVAGFQEKLALAREKLAQLAASRASLEQAGTEEVGP